MSGHEILFLIGLGVGIIFTIGTVWTYRWEKDNLKRQNQPNVSEDKLN